ncbi:permease [Rhodococcus sp. KRD162]|uniref:permease n=1 Tax=Rhodococcus sp. KRD162 TaxID=2729725 RepID=UPI0019D0A272|nr:permease [Rhodococcus sp. KRD162]
MNALGHALSLTASMAWSILWALIFGFTLSAVIQAVVRRSTIVRALGDHRPRTLAVATGFGMASSSCSYASVALARSLFRRGADFTAAMAFEIASTNLVIELGVILALLMGWQFTLAEFMAGPIIIVIVALLFRIVLRRKVLDAAAEQADKALAGSMEGHAAMDMSADGDGSFLSRLFSGTGATAVANVFVMEWAAIWKDLLGGLLIAGAIGAWVPNSFWQGLFLEDSSLLSAVWGPIIGPIVGIFSFVCSVGNVPLAVVLWTGGISFGGVMAFIFADLLILPILNIYRKYYGMAMTVRIVLVFYIAMVATGYIIEIVFSAFDLVPDASSAHLPDEGISWNYTTWLNILALVLAAALVTRFFRQGGASMLSMMGGSPSESDGGKSH